MGKWLVLYLHIMICQQSIALTNTCETAETSADIYVRCKQREIEQLRRSSSGVPPYVATYPKEIKRLLRENKLQGGRVVCGTLLCILIV